MESLHHKLIYDYTIYDTRFEITLIYRGNENIVIRKCITEKDKEPREEQILIDRHILEKFMEMIK